MKFKVPIMNPDVQPDVVITLGAWKVDCPYCGYTQNYEVFNEYKSVGDVTLHDAQPTNCKCRIEVSPISTSDPAISLNSMFKGEPTEKTVITDKITEYIYGDCEVKTVKIKTIDENRNAYLIFLAF